MQRGLAAWTFLLATSFATSATAQELGSMNAGKDYAQRVCAACHDVEKGDVALFPDVPSFQEIADTQGMSPRALRVWLQTSHPNMPDIIVPPADMDNVIAYIMSLKTPK
jgi:mono/diheme cytochrome c family protein